MRLALALTLALILSLSMVIATDGAVERQLHGQAVTVSAKEDCGQEDSAIFWNALICGNHQGRVSPLPQPEVDPQLY